MNIHADGRLVLNQSRLAVHALNCVRCRLVLFAEVVGEHHPRAQRQLQEVAS